MFSPDRFSPSPVPVALVDDEGAIRYLLSAWLGEAGYRPLLCANAEEALNLLCGCRCATEPVRLLVTDIRMPDLMGTDLARRVCSERPELPVLYISGYLDEHALENASEVRRFEFLAKPFGRETFLAAVTRLLAPGFRANATRGGADAPSLAG